MRAVTAARRQGAAAAAVVACLLTSGVAPRPAAATPSQDLERARDSFRAGDCAAAIPTLTTLLYPTPHLARPDDLSEAHVLLGVCQLTAGDQPAAAREFEQALFLRADYSLDALLFAPDAVRLFEQVKAEVTARAERDRALRALADEKDRLKKYRDSLIVYEVHPYYVNFVPLGAGQFQNGQRGRGLFFAVAEGATGAASAGLWLYLVSAYGYGGSVPTAEAAGARRLQQLEIGAGAAFLGLYAWGVIDALLHYRPRAQVQGDDSLLPPELRAPPPKESRLHLGPTLLPGGAGAALTWEY